MLRMFLKWWKMYHWFWFCLSPLFFGGGGYCFPFEFACIASPLPPKNGSNGGFFFKKSFPKSENFVKQHATRFCIVYSDTKFTIFCTTLFHLSRDRWEARDSGLRFLGSFRGGVIYLYFLPEVSRGVFFGGVYFLDCWKSSGGSYTNTPAITLTNLWCFFLLEMESFYIFSRIWSCFQNCFCSPIFSQGIAIQNSWLKPSLVLDAGFDRLEVLEIFFFLGGSQNCQTMDKIGSKMASIHLVQSFRQIFF